MMYSMGGMKILLRAGTKKGVPTVMAGTPVT